MADWGSPISGSQNVVSGALAMTQVLPSTTANTKGASWTTIATLERSGVLYIASGYAGANANYRTFLIDLAIEVSGTPTIFLNNLLKAIATPSASYAYISAEVLMLPITLPTGAVVRAKVQSLIASDTTGIYLGAWADDTPSSWTGSEITTYGADTANSAGVTVSGNAGDMVLGSYAQISSSCERMDCFFVAIGSRVLQDSYTNQDGTWQLAVGGAGSEQMIATGKVYSCFPPKTNNPQWFGPFYRQIAAGQRISARIARGGSGQKDLDFIVYGMR